MEKKKTITILIPCFNESDVLPLLYDRLRQLSHPDGCELNVLFIDDGSTDSTWAQLEAFALNHEGWDAIRLARNFGHQRALWVGLQNVDSDAVFTIDADLQDPPELIGEFAAEWFRGTHIVYGVRRKRKESVFKRLAYNSFYRILDRVADIKIPLDSGDFCLMDRKVVSAILLSRESMPFIRGLRAWVGFNHQPIEYERDSRAAGIEKYNLSMLVELAVDGLFGYSKKPIRLIGIVAGMVILFASLAGAVSLTAFMAGVFSLTLFAFLGFSSLFLLATGSILGAIGIVGEYVIRIFESSSQRPVAIMRETTQRKLAHEQDEKVIPIGIDRKAA